MKVIRGLPEQELSWPYPVVAVGNFDGVHLGHQTILRSVLGRARERNGTAVAVTFEPHPVKVLAPERPLHLLTGFEDKVRQIGAIGLDYLICIPFTIDFSRQKPSEFVEGILSRVLKAREIFVGENFAFGYNRQGTAEDLKRIGSGMGMAVSIIPRVRVDGQVVSSSLIRRLISGGDVGPAARLLGRPYEVSGEVVSGAQRGRTLGYPTANIQCENQLLPGPGVYVMQVIRAEQPVGPIIIPAVGYIGSRPTFGGEAVGLEVHLLRFEGDLYRERLRIAFLERLRGEQRFGDRKALADQIRQDVQRALQLHEAYVKESGVRALKTC